MDDCIIFHSDIETEELPGHFAESQKMSASEQKVKE